MSTQLEPRYTEEEYLALERASETKSEYLDGVIYAMGNASARHAHSVSNIRDTVGFKVSFKTKLPSQDAG